MFNLHLHSPRPRFIALSVTLLTYLLSASTAPAVILYSTPNRNLTAPTGQLAFSGWQYEGSWGLFLGTPIAPGAFITAQHVGGDVGQSLHFAGQDYATTGSTDIPNSDLRIWTISGQFPYWAPLYTGSDEIGQHLVVIGRGTARGPDVVDSTNTLKGWYWGTYDTKQSWGENEVKDADHQALQFNFDPNGGPNEAGLSSGDSGGGVFIREDGQWKLAGVNWAVTGPFSFDPSGADPFSASIFDMGGLYLPDEHNIWFQVPQDVTPTPGASYASRISTRLPWIYDALGGVPESSPSPVPEPSTALILVGFLSVSLIRRRSMRSRRHG